MQDDVNATPTIVCKVPPEEEAALSDALRRALPEARLLFWPETDHAAEYGVVCFDASGVADLPKLRLIVSITAGVERLLGSGTLPPGIPVVRGVSAGMTQHMTEYVVHSVLAHHRQARIYREQQAHSEWKPLDQPVSSARSVGILGLGVLGAASAQALAALGFAVSGWSRSEKHVPGVASLSGEEGLDRLLRGSDILVNLLPLTPETERLLDGDRLALLPRGACLVSASRSGIIDEQALLAALDSGQIAEATLDVFDAEPLPPGHPFWTHPRVTVTPHCAGPTDLTEVAMILADSMRRLDRGEPLVNRVDVSSGY